MNKRKPVRLTRRGTLALSLAAVPPGVLGMHYAWTSQIPQTMVCLGFMLGITVLAMITDSSI